MIDITVIPVISQGHLIQLVAGGENAARALGFLRALLGCHLPVIIWNESKLKKGLLS